MPYLWTLPDGNAAAHIDAAADPFIPAPDTATTELRLWPHRSLPRGGFVWFIGITCALIGLPLIAVIGSPVLWGLLPFIVAAVSGVWWALRRNDADREIVERMTLAPARVTLDRTGPRGRRQVWEANPHWVRVELHPTGGPVPHYITLKGGPREVELGAFLSEEERVHLAGELRVNLSRVR